MQRKIRESLIIASLFLTGCQAASHTLDTSLSYAEDASREMTKRSLDWICNRMSTRQKDETFGRDEKKLAAVDTVCEGIKK